MMMLQLLPDDFWLMCSEAESFAPGGSVSQKQK